MSEQQVLPELEVTEKDRMVFCQKAVSEALRRYPEECAGSPHRGLGYIGTYSGMVADHALRQLASSQSSLAQSEAERERLQGEVSAYEKHMKAAEDVLGHSQFSSRPLCDTAKKWVTRAETKEAELARERERHQELRQVVTNATYRMIALHGGEDYEECSEALWDCDCDLAKEYRDARAVLVAKAEPKPAPVATGEERE